MRPAPARVGDHLDDVDTPALIVELDPFERNLDRMAEAAARFGVKLRAHAKTHKCPTIARLQVERGAVGVCCQTVGEAEVMVDAGIPGVLITNQVVAPGKIARLVPLAARGEVLVCADDERNVRDLSRAAAGAGVRLDVLVEVDVGQNRCGVDPGEPALDLAKRIARLPGLRFAGLHAYHGKAQHVFDPEDRRRVAEEVVGRTRETVALLRKSGLEVPIVTGSGTGAFPEEAAGGAYTEVQSGSYIFMDVDYDRVREIRPRFEHSLFVLTTVISRRPERAVCDAGLKASSTDCGLPVVKDRPGVVYEGASDEHGHLRLDGDRVELGERLTLVPGHCDPTVNLHDHVVCVRDGRVEAVWEIAARGRF